MHELEPAACARRSRCGRHRRHRDADRAALGRPWRIRGPPRFACAAAADGRPVHLLRPLRTGGDPRRAGSRCASPPPYRARDRHLSLSRRDPASRQRGLETDHPARRRQLDGGRARHHPFRANARRGPQEAAQWLRASDLGRAAGARTRKRRRASSTTPGRRCRSSRAKASASAHPRPRLWRSGAGQGVFRDLLRRRRAKTRRAHAPSRRSRGAWRLYPRRCQSRSPASRSRPGG